MVASGADVVWMCNECGVRGREVRKLADAAMNDGGETCVVGRFDWVQDHQVSRMWRYIREFVGKTKSRTLQCTVSGTRGTPAACAPGAPRDPIR